MVRKCTRETIQNQVRKMKQAGRIVESLINSLGSKSCCGWSAIGRDCRGSAPLILAGRAAGRGTVSKRHCSNSFFFFIYVFFYICGDPKMGYNRCPLFIMLTEQHGFCVVSFIKINKTELPKLILSKLDLSGTVFTAARLQPEKNDQNLVLLRSQSGNPLTSNLD